MRPEKKDAIIVVRVTESIARRLRDIAREEGRSMGEVVRSAIADYLRTRRATIKAAG